MNKIWRIEKLKVYVVCSILAVGQGVSQAWDTALYVVFPNQRNVVFSQLGKETKSYNKKKIESKTNSKKRCEK